MPVYCVSYDLNVPGKNYDDLIAEIKKSPGYIRFVKSGWLVSTKETADVLFQRLFKNMDKSDNILVIGVTPQYQGWLSEDVWEWIRNHVG